MTTDYNQIDQRTWRPQAHLRGDINSPQQIKEFNDTGGVAVFIDVIGNVHPNIKIFGSQSRVVSLWETRSESGFVTKPKFSAELLTIRFVTSGEISYLTRSGKVSASPLVAVLTGFDELQEVQASDSIGTVSATIAIDRLDSANVSLTGDNFAGLPDLEPIADMRRQGMQALYETIRLVIGRLQTLNQNDDLILPLLQEIIIYQLLSSWPRRQNTTRPLAGEATSRQLRLAIDYIEANISDVLTLADIAGAARIGVRSLQNKFKTEFGCTPFQFVIKRRLARAHEDLLTARRGGRSVAQIARSYGFVHMSDFGQRYRRMYGCTPSQTRQEAEGD